MTTNQKWAVGIVAVIVVLLLVMRVDTYDAASRTDHAFGLCEPTTRITVLGDVQVFKTSERTLCSVAYPDR